MDLSEHGEGFEAAELLRRRKKKKQLKPQAMKDGY